jgi:hypothetical protein
MAPLARPPSQVVAPQRDGARDRPAAALPFGMPSTTRATMRPAAHTSVTSVTSVTTVVAARRLQTYADLLTVLAIVALLATLLALPLGAQSSGSAGRVDDSSILASRVESSNRRIDAGMRLPEVARANRVLESNAHRLDRALRRVDRSYARLTRAEHARIRAAFDALLPERSIASYAINDPQARAIVFLAFEDRDAGRDCDRYRDRDCDGDRDRDDRDDRPRACSANIDRISRDAGWINQAVAPLRRSSSSALGHDRELAILESVEERARQVAVASSRCACPAARDKASDLLELARNATARHREGITSAWMTVGDERLARLQVLARDVEREALRCGM